MRSRLNVVGRRRPYLQRKEDVLQTASTTPYDASTCGREVDAEAGLIHDCGN